MTNPPNSNWTGPSGSQLFDLLPATNYSFTLSVSDQGGVAHASLNLPRELSVLEVSPAEVSTSSDALTTTLTLSGDRDDPRTGLVMSGRLRTPDLGSGNGLSFEFKTEGRDFGGRSGASPNDRFMRVNASVGLPI